MIVQITGAKVPFPVSSRCDDVENQRAARLFHATPALIGVTFCDVAVTQRLFRQMLGVRCVLNTEICANLLEQALDDQGLFLGTVALSRDVANSRSQTQLSGKRSGWS